MLDGRGNFEWAQTANILALHLNLNRRKGAPLIEPRRLNPFAEKKRKAENSQQRINLDEKESGEVLRTFFCTKK